MLEVLEVLEVLVLVLPTLKVLVVGAGVVDVGSMTVCVTGAGVVTGGWTVVTGVFVVWGVPGFIVRDGRPGTAAHTALNSKKENPLIIHKREGT